MSERLLTFGIEAGEAAREAEIMLSTASGLSPAEIILKGEEEVPEPVALKLAGYIDRRSRREPLQHILGEAYFMGLPFAVGPAVLVPRPETEELVEHAVAANKKLFGGRAKILDIGAGSGAICVGMLVHCPQSTAVAIEVSAEAAAVCLANAEAHGVAARLNLKTADFMAASGRLSTLTAGEKFQIFVSNPPYIRKDLMDSLDPEVRDYDPHLALVGPDDDGLGFYRAFARYLPDLAAGEGAVIFAEFGQGQGAEIQAIFEDEKWERVSLLSDLSGQSRILTATVAAASSKLTL